MSKLIVLDYSTATVDIFDVDGDKDISSEDIVSEFGFRPSDCNWMFVDNLQITIH